MPVLEPNIGRTPLQSSSGCSLVRWRLSYSASNEWSGLHPRLSGCLVFSGKRVFEPAEVLRVVAGLELAVVTLESQVWRVALLGPISAGLVLAEVVTVVLRIRRLQLSCLTTLAHWLATESQLQTRLSGLLRDTVIAVSTGVVGAVARMLLPAQTGPADLQKLWSTTATGAQNLSVALDRLGATAARSSAVRIEESVVNGKRNFVVYLPGTQVWAPNPQPNPFSLSSDLRLYAGLPSAAQSGVNQLLQSQGIGALAGDRVLFVAHSQGAMVAARLAKNLPAGTVRGLITVGGPIAAMELPPTVSAVNLTHTLDLVPKLPLVSPTQSPQSVNLEIAAARANDPHELKSYRNSAARLETAAGYDKFRRVTDALLTPTANREVRVTEWQLTSPRY